MHKNTETPLCLCLSVDRWLWCPAPFFQTQTRHQGPQDPLVCNKVRSKHDWDFEKHVLSSYISKLTSVNCFLQTILETSTCQRTKLNEFASVVCAYVSLCRGSIKQTLILLETHRFQISSPAWSIITASSVTALSEIPVWTEALCLTLGSHAEASHWLAKICKTALWPNSA